MKGKGNLSELVSTEVRDDWYERKFKTYDLKKLEEWEKSYEIALIELEGTNQKEGLEHLFALAEDGYCEAMDKLCDLHIAGEILPESFEEAVKWYRRAQYAKRLFREDDKNRSS